MITLLKCEFLKTRHCHVLLTSLAVTVLGLCWGLYGNYTDVLLKHGWRMFLYQLPLVNAIFLPLLAMLVASRLCGIEHKGDMLKGLCCMVPRGKFYHAKLLYGLGILTVCTVIMWSVTVAFGIYKGFQGDFPVRLYLLYLLFTLIPTMVIFILQYTLSLVFKNQAIPFSVGILGEFAGLFSMFLPQIPLLRKCVLWGYYGTLQFVGMFGWSKDTWYASVHFDVLPIDWFSFGALIAAGVALYFIGRYLFIKKEV